MFLILSQVLERGVGWDGHNIQLGGERVPKSTVWMQANICQCDQISRGKMGQKTYLAHGFIDFSRMVGLLHLSLDNGEQDVVWGIMWWRKAACFMVTRSRERWEMTGTRCTLQSHTFRNPSLQVDLPAYESPSITMPRHHEYISD